MLWYKNLFLNHRIQRHMNIHTVSLMKPTGCTDFSNLFWHETLHVSDSSSVHHQEFFTVHTAIMYVTQVCRQLSNRIGMFQLLVMDRGTVHHQEFFLLYTQKSYTSHKFVDSFWTGSGSCISWWWTEELTKTCRVLCQNKFKKLVHLICFIIRICHDAWSHKRKRHTVLIKADLKP